MVLFVYYTVYIGIKYYIEQEKYYTGRLKYYKTFLVFSHLLSKLSVNQSTFLTKLRNSILRSHGFKFIYVKP